MTAVFDARACFLGEGPLWHPERGQLFWFDIINKRLLSRSGEDELVWQFDEHVSAAGWIDADHLLIASETGLWRFDIKTGDRSLIAQLESDMPDTRSNDGRADRQGGFWIGTMGKNAEPGRGAIYRFYKGELRKLFGGLTITNSICFAPDGSRAYFCDTTQQRIMQVALSTEGWPEGEPAVFVDLKPQDINPDGSATDAEGYLWNAEWGRGAVSRYAPDGTRVSSVQVDGKHSTCPAFGGADFRTLLVTTACEGMDHPDDRQGLVYAVPIDVAGLPEPQVLL